MEKRLRLMKSFLQTCYFSLRFQKNIAIILATFMLFAVNNFLFYSPYKILYGFGINIVIMTVLTLITVIVIHQPALNNRNFWWAAFGISISAMNLVFHHNEWGYFMYFSSYFLLIGHLHGEKFRNVFMGFVQWFIINICSPISLIVYLSSLEYWDKAKWKSLNRMLNLIIIPIILFILFVVIYSVASKSFHDMLEPFLAYFRRPHIGLDFDKIAFFIISCIMILPAMIPIHKKITLVPRAYQHRMKRKRCKKHIKFKISGLNTELKIASLSFIGLNTLVMIFNMLDIRYVWFGNAARTAAELSNYVHDGTNMIIISILIGVGLILIFFRENLNFHPKNSWLKRLIYIWLAQNAFLALSVIRRNAHYVAEYGLTEKRMGLIIFLLLLLLALYFCLVKVANKQSLHWLFNKLCLSFFLITLCYSVVNHERLIIQHAVHFQQANVDLSYLNQMSSNNVDLLIKYKDKLESKSAYTMELLPGMYPPVWNRNWREWNVADAKRAKNNRYLNINPK